MSDETVAAETPDPPAEPTPPETFKVKVNGHELEIPAEEYHANAQRAIAQDQFDANKKAWYDGGELRREAEELISLAQKDPNTYGAALDEIRQAAMNGTPLQRRGDPEGTPQDGTDVTPPAANTTALENRIKQLEGVVKGDLAERAATTRADTLRAEVDSHDLIRGNEPMRDLALAYAEMAQVQAPDISTKDAARIGQTMVQKAYETQRQNELDAAKAREQEFATTTSATPHLKPEREFTAKDLRSGGIKQAVLESFQKLREPAN